MFKASIGRFAGIHADSHDASTILTANTNFSRSHPDVEEEIFCIMDWGVAWVMEELSTFFFSGLHFHGGSQPYYKKDRTDTGTVYTRATFILYPASASLNGTGSMAFAALPDGTYLKSYREMRMPS